MSRRSKSGVTREGGNSKLKVSKKSKTVFKKKKTVKTNRNNGKTTRKVKDEKKGRASSLKRKVCIYTHLIDYLLPVS